MTQSLRALKILIVDDKAAVIDILSQLCSLLGHEVLSAGNGAEALTLMESESCIDIVFTDHKMPVMDGLEMVKHIKAQRPNLPVVLITGAVFVSSSAPDHAYFDAVVHKPFQLKTIADTIAQFFPQQEAAPGN